MNKRNYIFYICNTFYTLRNEFSALTPICAVTHIMTHYWIHRKVCKWIFLNLKTIRYNIVHSDAVKWLHSYTAPVIQRNLSSNYWTFDFKSRCEKQEKNWAKGRIVHRCWFIPSLQVSIKSGPGNVHLWTSDRTMGGQDSVIIVGRECRSKEELL